MFAKVCGLKSKAHIDRAIEFGYDAVGIVTYAKSRRYCTTREAVELAQYAKGRIKRFVVGITYADVRHVADHFDFVQIYEPIELPNLVLASKEKPPPHIAYQHFIYDASIGSGVFHQFPRWVKDRSSEIIIAGGLTIDNVGGVIREIKPFGVDVSSGVEKAGVKDSKMMKDFIDAARNAYNKQ